MSRHPLMRRLVLATAAAAMVAGCTTNPTSTPTVSTRPAPPSLIPRPLDASRYATEQMICQLLTDEQATKLGFVDDTPYSQSRAKLSSCTRDQSGNARANIIYYLDLDEDARDEFERMYRDNRDFHSALIAGQPAVWSAGGITRKPPDYCRAVVALNERQSVSMTVTQDDSRDACQQAVAVIEQIVHNLGG